MIVNLEKRTPRHRLYRAEVIANFTNEWTTNGVSFATRLEAEAYLLNLVKNWPGVHETRVVTDYGEATYTWDHGRLVNRHPLSDGW